MAKKKVESKKLQVTLLKSPIGNPEPQKRRLHQTVIHNDTPALRGMLHKVRHLIEVIEQD
jgi:large subunit ribosomal protein L30